MADWSLKVKPPAGRRAWVQNLLSVDRNRFHTTMELIWIYQSFSKKKILRSIKALNGAEKFVRSIKGLCTRRKTYQVLNWMWSNFRTRFMLQLNQRSYGRSEYKRLG